MSEDAASGAERFAALVEAFRGRPDVPAPSQSGGHLFGSTALKVHGSIFAMLRGDQLVVKLPRARVTALLDAGTGETFDAGKGKPMKEWSRFPAPLGSWSGVRSPRRPTALCRHDPAPDSAVECQPASGHCGAA